MLEYRVAFEGMGLFGFYIHLIFEEYMALSTLGTVLLCFEDLPGRHAM